jgi:large subunit ribosomal protein L13
MKTTFVNTQTLERQWFIFDAEDKTLGRFSTEIANILRGKNKPSYSPSHDTGDNVIIINAEKLKLTGKKLDNKYYFRHSGYVGGLKAENAAAVMGKDPAKVVFHSIRGMVPRNRNRKGILSKLHIYSGAEHPHEAQKPVTLEL